MAAIISAAVRVPMDWAEIKTPVRPSPTFKWSLATTGNNDSELKARAFMIKVMASTPRITRFCKEYRIPRDRSRRKGLGSSDRAGIRDLIWTRSNSDIV